MSAASVLKRPPMMMGVPKSASERTNESSRHTSVAGRMSGRTISRRMAPPDAPRSRAERRLPSSSFSRMPERNIALSGTNEIDCIRMTPQRL